MRVFSNKFKIISILAVFTISLALTGCGSNPKSNRHYNQASIESVIKAAKQMLGIKYRYGGTSPRHGFDCSGLVQYSHKAAGIHLPRTTRQQFRATKRISRKYLKAGDLVFFKTSVSRSISHVGIYIGNNKFIHAPSTGKNVKINSLKEKYWRKRFSGAGRIF